MISSLRQCFEYILDTIAQHIQRWVKLENPSLFTDAVFDLTRSKSELMLENAFLRQQLIVLNRQVIRPAIKPRERVFLVVLASGLRSWKQALAIVQPDTLLRWHRYRGRHGAKDTSVTTSLSNGRAPTTVGGEGPHSSALWL